MEIRDTVALKFVIMMVRLEEKCNNLESENKVLRQQAVSIAPNKFLSGRSRSILQVRIIYQENCWPPFVLFFYLKLMTSICA